MIKKNVCITLVATFGTVFAATETWVGTTPNLTLNTNWSPATVPVTGDTAIFNASGISHAPTLSSGVNLTTGTFNFTDATAYSFTIGNARTLTLIT